MDADVRRWLRGAARVESAVAYGLPPDLEAEVLDRRSRGEPSPEALTPHLTLCYLGRMSGETWRRLFEVVAALGLPPTLEATVTGLGTFRGGDGMIRNLHLAVARSDALVGWHDRILAACGAEWAGFAPGPFTGAGWVPHVSVLDAVDLGASLPDAVGTPLAARTVMLERPHLLARRIDPVTLPL